MGKLTTTVEQLVTVVGTVTTVKRDMLGDFKFLTVEKIMIHMNKVFQNKTPSATVPTSVLKMFNIDPANDTADKAMFYL